MATGPVRLRPGDRSGILNTIPLLLGYEPADGDVVLLCLGEQGRLLVTFRCEAQIAVEYPDDIRATLASLPGQGVLELIVVGYGPGDVMTPTADHIAEVASEWLTTRDSLRVEGDRYWPPPAADHPPEGYWWQREPASATALQLNRGQPPAPSREALTERFAAPTDDEVRQAWAHELGQPAPSLRTGRQIVEQAMADSHAGKLPTDAEAARIARALTAMPVRDHAWARMAPEHAAEHADLWASITRRTPDEGVAAPASLLAFTAWQAGRGAVANMAVERALAADSDYQMALQVREALAASLAPDRARVQVTPAEVEQSWRAAYEVEDLKAAGQHTEMEL